jgi:hypothetical protein
MKICGHIVDKAYIIGISPLMVHQSTDQATRMLYNSKQLWFHLHCKHHSIKIESDWFEVGTVNNTEKIYLDARKRYKDFTDEYNEAAKLVEGLIIN